MKAAEGIWVLAQLDRRGTTLLALLLSSFFVMGQDAYPLLQSGIQGRGMAGSRCFGEQSWVALGDPAAEPERGTGVTLQCGQPYSLPGMLHTAISLSGCAGSSLVGVAYSRSGNRERHMERLGLGGGIAISKDTRLGAAISLFSARWAPGPGKGQSLGGSMSLSSAIGPKFRGQMMAGFHLPFLESAIPYHAKDLQLIAGIQYIVLPAFRLNMELERQSRTGIQLRCGALARLSERNTLTMGYAAATHRMTVAWVIRLGSNRLGFAADHHPLLGNSPWVEYTYRTAKEK